MFDWRNILRGFAMGVTDLIPGVSGGTVALLLGIYRKLVDSLSGMLHLRQWKESLLFLIPLALGIGAALLTVSGGVEWLLDQYPQPTFYFFLGLIIGILPILAKQIDYKNSFRTSHYGILVVSAILIALTVFVRAEGLGQVMDTLTPGNMLFLFVSGWLASTAMILPGISGSFVLLLLGAYPTFIYALSNLQLSILIIIGAGIALGLLLTSKLISILLDKFTTATYAVIIGLVAGSVIVVFPGIPTSLPLWMASLLSLVVGYAIAAGLGRIEQRSK